MKMQAKMTADAATFVAQLCMAAHACILQGLHAQAWYKQASNKIVHVIHSLSETAMVPERSCFSDTLLQLQSESEALTPSMWSCMYVCALHLWVATLHYCALLCQNCIQWDHAYALSPIT